MRYFSAAALLSLFLLSACAETQPCRTYATAELGAAVGSIAFPVGTIIGGGIGAWVGSTTTKQDVDFGGNPWCN